MPYELAAVPYRPPRIRPVRLPPDVQSTAGAF